MVTAGPVMTGVRSVTAMVRSVKATVSLAVRAQVTGRL
jgi:hypothetical protein